MGNRSSWLTSNIEQVPGLIKSTWDQATGKWIEGESSNIPFQVADRPFVTYRLLVDGLSSPVSFADPGFGPYRYIVDQVGVVYRYDPALADKSDRVRVDQEHGTVYIRGNNTITQSPLLDLSDILTPLNPVNEERGLLCMVFHPTKKGIFYLYYTVPPQDPEVNNNCDVILDEWQLTESAEPIREILRWPHPDANHFGSPIGFGEDGLLYLATGDGGGAGDKHGPIGNAQDLNSHWGKIYTIDVDSIDPKFNLYSYGHRNPWRGSFTFDGLPIVGDVGQDKWEGITIDHYGDNHGWKAVENGHVYDAELYNELVNRGEVLVNPVLWYDRSIGRAVIGGYQLSEKTKESPLGDYLFGDYIGGKFGDNVYLVKNGILWIQPKQDRYKFLHSFGMGRDGAIYGLFTDTLSIKSEKGALYKIEFV